MDQNEAITRIAQSAIEHIHQFALEAIKATGGIVVSLPLSTSSHTSTDQAEKVTALLERATDIPQNTEEKISSDSPKRTRGRPARTPASPDSSEYTQVAPTTASTVTSTAVEDALFGTGAEESDAVSEETLPDFDLANGVFPDYTISWFENNLETGRGLCRDLLTERLKFHKNDAETVKAEMIRLSKQGRVAAFAAENCFDYYNGAIDLIKQSRAVGDLD